MKKWLIGCGGCLGVVILLVIVGVVGTTMWVGGSADKASTSLLGGKAPDGYFALGMTFPEKSKTTAGLMLTNTSSSNVIFVFDHSMSEAEAATLNTANAGSKEFNAAIEALVKKGMSSSDSGNSDSEMTVVGVKTAALENGKNLPVVLLKLYSARKGVYAPLVLGLVPQAENRLVLLAGILNPNAEGSTSTDADADFSAGYERLTDEVTGIVSDTSLDDRLK